MQEVPVFKSTTFCEKTSMAFEHLLTEGKSHFSGESFHLFTFSYLHEIEIKERII